MKKNFPPIHIVIIIGILFILFFGYFFLSAKNQTNDQTSFSESDQVSQDQVSESRDTITIQKDDSGSITGGPASLIPPPFDSALEEQAPQKKQTFPVTVGTKTLHLERADSEYAQTHGLTNRPSLPKDEGMLYIVTKHQEFSYWGKDMRFATDVIWIGPDLLVVDISRNITPESYPNSIFTPSRPARYVIEMNAGVADATGIDIGDSIDLSRILGK